MLTLDRAGNKVTQMTQRASVFVMVFVFAGLMLVAGAPCAGMSGGVACCCTPGVASDGGPLITSCCEMECGTRTVESSAFGSSAGASSVVPQLPKRTLRADDVSQICGPTLPVVLKAQRTSVSDQPAPDVFLQNASFLI